MGNSLREIGNIYSEKIKVYKPEDEYYDKSMDYYNQSEKVFKEIEYEPGIGNSKHDKSWIYWFRGDYNQVLKDREYALAKWEEIGQEWYSAMAMSTLGDYYLHTGNLSKALDMTHRGYKIHEKINSVAFKSGFLYNLGLIHLCIGENKTAIDYFKKLLSHIKEAEKNAFTHDIGNATLILFFCYKKVGKKYNKQKIINYINETSNISWHDNYLISQILEDNSYLKTAYSQVMKEAAKREDKFVNNFLNSLIPSIIVEEWEKVK